ncbi:hypothetical protein [Phenylobacterium sp.]|uniref:hypothetical protein n=1 Tax=Phenylobacterium sp. TaxID=1871053 RepID=UPI002FC810AA
MRWRFLLLASIFYWISPPWTLWAAVPIPLYPWQVNVALISESELLITSFIPRYRDKLTCEAGRYAEVELVKTLGGLVEAKGELWTLYGTWCGLDGVQT